MPELSEQDINGIFDRLNDLASAVKDLREASTKTEKKEAKEDVSEAETALKRYAEARGISLSEAEDAIEAVKRNQQKNQMREILKELLEEDDLFPEDEKKEENKKEEEKKEETKNEQDADSVPNTTGHWTDQRVFGK